MHKGNTEPSYRKRVVYHATLLGGMALIVTAFLAAGDLATRDRIQQRLEDDLKNLLSEVVPKQMHNNNLLEDIVVLPVEDSSLFGKNELTVYRAKQEAEIVGAAFEVIGQGYAGDIHVLLGIKPDGELFGVRVVSHLETPGLGDKIEAKKSDWIKSFSGLSLDNTGIDRWAVKKDGGQFDQFSGATITPRAVVKAIKSGLNFFNKNQLAILSPSEAENKGEDTL